jgi:organic hydroperoxide reductase OsmC/OhrA
MQDNDHTAEKIKLDRAKKLKKFFAKIKVECEIRAEERAKAEAESFAAACLSSREMRGLCDTKLAKEYFIEARKWKEAKKATRKIKIGYE